MGPERNDPLPREAATFLAGEEAAVETVRRWARAVVRRGGWRFSDEDEIVQEVVVRLYGILRAGSFQGRSRFRTFVFSVARHVCIDAFRDSKKRLGEHKVSQEPRPDRGASASSSLEARERRERLSYVYWQLPEDCRQLWVWLYRDGFPTEEIARRLERRRAVVRLRIHRCLTKAREISLRFIGGRG